MNKHMMYKAAALALVAAASVSSSAFARSSVEHKVAKEKVIIIEKDCHHCRHEADRRHREEARRREEMRRGEEARRRAERERERHHHHCCH
ncbi:MAG: hypothetical protein Q4F30_02050 [Akkermansia sp.]|nr:hypothetical protein [Akkermansia sp.]